jgi:DNA-binding IclR family transcriptional regulator
VEGSGVYVLGPAIVELDRNIRLSDPLVTVATPAMKWLSEQARVPCAVLLCRLYRDRVMCIHEEKTATDGKVSYERGRLMPLSHGAPSKVILSQLSPRQLARLVGSIRAEAGPDAPFDYEAFRKELTTIRKQAHVVTRGEVDTDVVGIAVPLATPFRGIVASLGVACFGIPDEIGLVRVRALLTATAETIKGSITHDERWK